MAAATFQSTHNLSKSKGEAVGVIPNYVSNPFRLKLLKIIVGLKVQDVRDLSLLYEEMPASLKDGDAVDFVNWLESMDKIDEINRFDFGQNLQKIGRIDLYRVLNGIPAKNTPVSDKPEPMPIKKETEEQQSAAVPGVTKSPSQLQQLQQPIQEEQKQKIDECDSADRPFTKEELYIVKKIGANWKNLGRELHISSTVLNKIERDHRFCDECADSMMTYWIQTEGQADNLQKLISALEDIPRRDITDPIKRWQKTSQVAVTVQETGIEETGIVHVVEQLE